MEERMPYLGDRITIKENEITKTSQFFQITCLQEQAPQPTLKPDSFLGSLHHKTKRHYDHGLIHTISRSLMENGGKSIEEW
jgi:hypothetical protein